ncbi:hypothetical protein TIFTF001_037675 [Ficus carica]|uniref:Uncharacterized protein n=1 Tax=Ficus carica TaxID=3494 RepID=A0AA88E966_FICCA|nr:hypothetical protein TIFTF001_037675 [Ficus carica]
MGAATLMGVSQKHLVVMVMVAAVILFNVVNDCTASAGISLNSTDSIVMDRLVDDLEFLMDSETARRVLVNLKGVTQKYVGSKNTPADCDRGGKYIGSCIGPKNQGGKKGDTRDVYKKP